MDRIDRIFDRNTDIISALVSSAFDYDMPISSKVYPVDPVYPVKFLFIELPFSLHKLRDSRNQCFFYRTATL